MTMGPVAVAALLPTDIDQDIDLPFRVMLCMLPLFRVGHMPLAAGSMVGVGPLVFPGVEPLEAPLASLMSDPEEPLDPLPALEEPEPGGPPSEEPPLEPTE